MRNNHPPGMTLIEMLLAVTLLSALMGAAGGIAQSALRSQLAWGKTAEPYVHLERSLVQIERDFSRAGHFFGAPTAGSAARLEFAAVDSRVVAGIAAPQWLRIVYRIEEGQLRREEYLWQAQSSQPLSEAVLLNMDEAEWLFGRLDAQGQLVWAGAWDGVADKLPQLIQLHLVMPGPGGNPVEINRVFRNPAGNLPQDQPQ